MIIGPPDTLYEGGFFKCHLHFPKEYPLKPPELRVLTEIWHPNIDKKGKVCISILHEPGQPPVALSGRGTFRSGFDFVEVFCIRILR
jgi:ubiquitin-protein ligase